MSVHAQVCVNTRIQVTTRTYYTLIRQTYNAVYQPFSGLSSITRSVECQLQVSDKLMTASVDQILVKNYVKPQRKFLYLKIVSQ